MNLITGAELLETPYFFFFFLKQTPYFKVQVGAECVMLLFFLKFLFILALLGLPCCEYFSLVAESRGYSLAVVHGLLVAVPSLLF